MTPPQRIWRVRMHRDTGDRVTYEVPARNAASAALYGVMEFDKGHRGRTVCATVEVLDGKRWTEFVVSWPGAGSVKVCPSRRRKAVRA